MTRSENAADPDEYDWEPRGEPSDGRGWQLPPGKECAKRFLSDVDAEDRGPSLTGCDLPEVLGFVYEQYEAGNHDALAGGVPYDAISERFDVHESVARDRLEALVDSGELVRVDGVMPERPYWPRKSYIPTELFDGDGGAE